MSTRALLDTHSFIWFIAGSDRLTSRARALIEAPENTIQVSVASLWEIAIKHGLGKLELARPFAELISDQLERQRIGILQIEVSHLTELITLPLHHRDPFDRLIVAHARLREWRLATGDDHILQQLGARERVEL